MFILFLKEIIQEDGALNSRFSNNGDFTKVSIRVPKHFSNIAANKVFLKIGENSVFSFTFTMNFSHEINAFVFDIFLTFNR